MSAWNRQRGLAAAQCVGGDQRIDDRRLLAVHLEHSAVPRGRPQRAVEVRIGQAEVVDHEGLEGRHAGVDEGGQLRDRVVLLAADDGAQAEVDRRLPRRAGAELVEPSQRRAGAVLADPGAGIVEGQDRGRAAGRRRQRVLAEPMRMLRIRQPQVRVDVDDAGEDQEPGRVDGLDAVSLQVGTDALDPTIGDRDVGHDRTVGRDDGATGDDEIGHRASMPRTDIARESASWRSRGRGRLGALVRVSATN